MSQKYEVFFRALSIFLTVYFTIGWTEKNQIKYDLPILIFAMVLALMLRYYF
jgi:hypothetical protein